MGDIGNLQKQIHEANVVKGFYAAERNIGELLALIHSEVSEALEADRKIRTHGYAQTKIEDVLDIKDEAAFKSAFEQRHKNRFEDELADILIRVMDLAEYKGINLEGHIEAKVRYNALRTHKHGKNY